MGKIDPLAAYVVREASRTLQPDADLVLLSTGTGSATIRYNRSTDPSCVSCSVSPEDLREWLLELFAQKAPHIRSVELEIVDR